MSFKLIPHDLSIPDTKSLPVSSNSTLVLNFSKKPKSTEEEESLLANTNDSDSITGKFGIKKGFNEFDDDTVAPSIEESKHFRYHTWAKKCLVMSGIPRLQIDVLYCSEIAISKPLLQR